MKPGEQFTCGSCRQTFKKGWADAEAEAEFDEIFGDLCERSQAIVVCSPCYDRINEERAL
jgi:hypothetical protein